jgi:4'-phosphopantetheinyl transferase
MPGSVNSSFIGQPNWRQPTLTNLLPETRTIYIWRGAITDFIDQYEGLFSLLSNQEQTAALRYYQVKDQQRYGVQHGVLRLLLGWYLNMPAKDIAYTYNETKKPYLIGDGCFFNLSHSHGEFLIAIGNKEQGIDIEHINQNFAFQDIASNYFSTEEVAFINRSKNPTEAFFLLWTRKEALLKACGTGIDDNLPAMPALNGEYNLPADYQNVDWLTESFYAGKYFMGSITYPLPKKNIVFSNLTIELIATLFERA